MLRQPSDPQPFYQYWQTALEDAIVAQVLYDRQRIEEGWTDDFRPPRCGFFRKKVRPRDRTAGFTIPSLWVPVAIWLESPVIDGELIDDEYFVALVGIPPVARPIRSTDGVEAIFQMSMKNPVTEAHYRNFLATGVWHDDQQKSLF